MSEGAKKPLVLHLAVDYPNAYRPENTVAVRSFVKTCEDLDHFVIALTRSANPFRAGRVDGDGKGDARVVSVCYWGLPLGILLALSMFIVAVRVRRLLADQGVSAVAVHAHKLSFEGLAGWWISRRARIPLIVSIRGEAESKILRFKPHYRPLLQRILNDAQRIYYVSAWFKPILNRHFHVPDEKQSLLPNFVADRTLASVVGHRRDHLITVLDLNIYRKKGLDRLLLAFRDCMSRFPNAQLDIIGRGDSTAVEAIQGMIFRLGLSGRVHLRGALPNEQLLAVLPAYAGFVLPSHNETFGMAYVEALRAGIPILHSKGTGIDGFVDWVKARICVDPSDQVAINVGLEEILIRQDEFRNWLRKNQRAVEKFFASNVYVSDYCSCIVSLA